MNQINLSRKVKRLPILPNTLPTFAALSISEYAIEVYRSVSKLSQIEMPINQWFKEY